MVRELLMEEWLNLENDQAKIVIPFPDKFPRPERKIFNPYIGTIYTILKTMPTMVWEYFKN